MKDLISQQDALHRLQSCIADIRAWMAASKLCLNDDKTEVLTICAPWLRQHMAVTNLELTVGLSRAAAVPAARNLGVMMDHALNIDTQIQHLCRTAMVYLRNIADIRRYLTQDDAEKTHPCLC